MASIQMNMGTETEINATPNKDGLILFDTTNKEIILDNNGTREVLTKHIEANPNLNGAEQLENLKVNGEVLNFLPVDISNVEKDGEEISDILEDKYNTEGDYDTTVDKCTDLTRITPVTDTAPYIYRQTPVKESFKALMKKIVGASVVWNQLAPQITSTNYLANVNANIQYSDNKATCVCVGGTAGIYQNTNSRFSITGHKYLISIVINSEQTGSFQIGFGNIGGSKTISETNKDMRFAIVQSATADGTALVCYKISSSENDTFTVSQYSAVDLTAMFGTTIADYVYTLETSQSGSGIAWLQSYGFFTEDYYAYKQNKLESGCVSAKKIVGFNQWDEEWEKGGIYTTNGETFASNTRIRSKNFNKCFPSTVYYFKSTNQYRVFCYDKNKNYITYITNLRNTTFTTPVNTYYFKIASISDETTYNNDICVNISNASVNGTYEPYTEITYPISPITLRGLFKLSTNKLIVDGDEYESNGDIKRKYGIVDLGSLDWSYTESANKYNFRSSISLPNAKLPSSNNQYPEALCAKLFVNKYTETTDNSITIIWEDSTYAGRIWVTARAYNDATTFKTAMSDVYLIYKLITPTTEQTTPFTETEIVGSTEEFIDYEVAQSNRDVAIPVGTETDYYQSYNIPPMPSEDCYLCASNQKLNWVSN